MPFTIDLPDNVEIEGFRCVKVWIPDSDGYESALHSLLTYLNNWFAWQRDEEKRGKEAAQHWRTAYRLTIEDFLSGNNCDNCEDGEDGEECEECASCQQYAISDQLAEAAMSLCGYNPKAFKIEEGFFWVKDFCGEWVSIGEITLKANDSPQQNPLSGTDEEPDEWSTCGKAAVLIDVLAGMVQAAIDNEGLSGGFEHAIRDVETRVTMGREQIWTLFPQISILRGLFADDRLINDFMVLEMKCRAAVGMEDTDVGSDAEVAFIFSSVKSAIAAESTPDELLLIYPLWQRMGQIIGDNDLKWLVALGASDFSQDCTCPTADPYTGVVVFDDTRVIHLESQGSSLAVAEFLTLHQMHYEVQGGQNANFQEVHWDERLNASGTIQELQLEFPLETADVSDYYPAIAWDDTNPTVLTNYMRPPVIGATAPTTTDYLTLYHKQIIIMKWAAPVDLDAASIDFGVKMNPQNQAVNPQRYDFKAEITYSGPLR